MNKPIYKKMLNELCSDCCCSSDHYCFLKEFMVECNPSPRLLIQLKCIEKFKYEISEKETRDIGWTEAVDRWASEGYAERFARFYSEDKKYTVIYKEIISDV